MTMVSRSSVQAQPRVSVAGAMAKGAVAGALPMLGVLHPRNMATAGDAALYLGSGAVGGALAGGAIAALQNGGMGRVAAGALGTTLVAAGLVGVSVAAAKATNSLFALAFLTAALPGALAGGAAATIWQ